MILGNLLHLSHKCNWRSLLLILLLLTSSNTALAVSLETGTDTYVPGLSLTISGNDFWSNEVITVDVKYTNDYVYDSWTVEAEFDGSFSSSWTPPYDNSLPDTLIIGSTGNSSGLTATLVVVCSPTSLHQLQNGTSTTSPAWANGNINTSNSCYGEGDAVPYRYFIKNLDSASSHYFTIQSEATKNYIHTFDYFTIYDISESGPITTVGGVCSPTAAAPPVDCSSPTGTFTFPDPTDSASYVSIPSLIAGIVNGSFSANGPRELSFYNAVVDSTSKYYYTGSGGTLELNVIVYFTTIDQGSTGFFWSGHLAQGTSTTWGTGNGSGSVSGAPYHMKTINFDGGGGANQDRSVQGATICLPPLLTIECSAIDSVCQYSNYACSVTAVADNYTWTVSGGTIVSGQGTSKIEYMATGYPGSTLTISLTACKNNGCDSEHCCSQESIDIYIGDCNPCIVTLTCPPDTTISCGASIDPSNTGTASYSTSGTCPTLTLSYSDSETAGACPQEKTITRIWKVTDPLLNVLASCQQIITVTDDIAPVFDQSCPANVSVSCQNVPTAPTLTATDNCDTSPAVTYSETNTPGSCTYAYTLTRSWTATDDCGNSSTCTQIITVYDDTNPVLSGCPSNVTVSCTNIPDVATVTATDNCDPSPTVTFNQITTPGNCTGNYTITRTWTATDACGNSSSCSQTITVQDNVSPVLSGCPSDITVECDNIPPPANVTATDNCSPVTINFIENATQGSCNNAKIITRTWVAIDECGNSKSCSQVITVIDTTPPVIVNCLADITVSCDNVPSAPTLTATDNCDLSPAVTFNESTTPGSCIGTYIITRTWTAVDACSNSSICTQVITVQDNIAPVLSGCPPDATVDCSSIPAVAGVTAVDNCGTVTINFNETTTPGACNGSYTITRTWTAIDDCSNFASCTQVITVTDTSAPVITGCPGNLSLQCTADLPDLDPNAVSATDNCGSITITASRSDNGASGCNGDLLIVTDTWTAVDDCGNESSCSRTITIEDTTPPAVLQCAPNLTLSCLADIPDCSPSDITYEDNCSLSGTSVTCNRTDNGGSGCAGNPLIITDIYTISDLCGNSTTCSRTITVEDNTSPVITSCPPNLNFTCISDVPDCNINDVTANDDCGSVSVVCNRTDNGATGCNGDPLIITDTYTVTDACGNYSSCSRTITVHDDIAPVCNVPNDTVIVMCDTATVCLPVNVTDNCSNAGCVVTNGIGTITNGQWCYFASDNSGTVNVQIQCTDACGNTSNCSFTVTFMINSKPELTIDPISPVLSCTGGDSVIAQFHINDPGNSITVTADYGWINMTDSTIHMIIGDSAGTYCNTIYVTDTCGLSDTANFCFDVSFAQALSITPDTTLNYGFVCTGFAGTLPIPVISGGLAPYNWTVDGLASPHDTTISYSVGECDSINNSWVFSVTDACGSIVTSTVTVIGTVNCPPEISITTANNYIVCRSQAIALDFSAFDINYNIASIGIIDAPTGTTLNLVDSTINFIPDITGIYQFTIGVTDSCGAFASASATISVTILEPVIIADSFHEQFLCSSGQICVPLPVVSQGTVVQWYVDGVMHNTQEICFTPVTSGTTIFEVVAVDGCQFADTAYVTVNVTVNPPLDLFIDNPDTLQSCSFPYSLCIPFSVTGSNGNLTFTTQYGVVNENTGTICFDVPASGSYCNRVIVTDSCNQADTVDYCFVMIHQQLCECPTITIEKTHNTIQGSYETVSVTINDLAYQIGGFNILIQYDASVLSFSHAYPGDMLETCGWEYFTYRYGQNGNCGNNVCPTGVLRVSAIAEVNNGANHPICFGYSNGDLFHLSFMVSNDRTYECQYAPIRFIWYSCSDNTLSNVKGDTLYISKDVYDFDNPVPITNIAAAFPSLFGANYSCDVQLGDGKPDPIRCIDFQNGGIDIVCADSIDARGDINLNEIGYEIADAVLFSNYFVYGLSVFIVNPEGQIAASDVNADGITLSVADLVYMIRVIIGDALPFPKLNPAIANLYNNDGVLSVTEPMGAAYIVADGNVVPELLATQMDIKYNFDADNNVTRILVYSFQPNMKFDGEFIQFDGNLISIEMATYEGMPVNAKVQPSRFVLHQNYPNPFNPKTKISFELAHRTEFKLTIYNVSGQVVAEFEGNKEAGVHEIIWDAVNSASGVYFYRLTTNTFSDVKKMILIK